MHKIRSSLLALIIFLAPTNFFLTLSENYSYVNGLRVDYLIPKLYLVAGLIIGYLLLRWWQTKKLLTWLKQQINWLKNQYLSGFSWLLLGAIIITQTIITAPVSGTWYLAGLLLVIIFGLSLPSKVKNPANSPLITGAFISAVIFQSAIGIFQFVQQQSLVGYYLLGEPNIARFLGLAKVVVTGKELVLPYGTTAHPNVLAGFLAVYLLTIWLITIKQTKVAAKQYFFTLLASIVGMIGLILTFSISAWGTLVFGIILILASQIKRLSFLLNKKLLIIIAAAILLVVPITIARTETTSVPVKLQHDSLFRRNYLNQAAVQMSANHPILGVGLNAFTRNVEAFSPEREVVRFVQPAHHAGLLWLAETGLVGVLFIGLGALLLYKQKRGGALIYALVIISPILALDHYLLSLFSGQLLLVLTSAITVTRLTAGQKPS